MSVHACSNDNCVTLSQYYILISHALQRNYAFIAFILVSGSQLLSAHDVLTNTMKLLAGFRTLGLGTLTENYIEGKCNVVPLQNYELGTKFRRWTSSGFLLYFIRILTRFHQDSYQI